MKIIVGFSVLSRKNILNFVVHAEVLILKVYVKYLMAKPNLALDVFWTIWLAVVLSGKWLYG